MVVGVLKLDLFLEGNRSLKDKRKIIRSIFGKVRSKFKNVSISEVGSNDLWQRATVGISIVTNDSPFANSVLNQVFNYIESMGICRIFDNKIEIFYI